MFVMSLLVLFIFELSLLPISQAKQNHLENIAYKVSNLHKFHNASQCVFLTKVENVTTSEPMNDSEQRVKFDMGVSNNAMFENYLIKEPKCVTLTYKGSSIVGLKAILDLSKYIRHHIIVYVSNERPNDNILISIVRPLVWITEDKEKMKIFIFCPKVGKPRLPVAKYTGVFVKNKTKLFMVSDFAETCANPFFGQIVSLYDPTSFPKYLNPARFKKLTEVAGYNIGFMKYFSQYHNFVYKAEFVRGGKYYFQNNTFSPGRFNGVMNGSAALTHGGHFPVFSPMFDLGTSFWLVKIKFITRNPLPIVSYGQILTPFPVNVWIISVCVIVLIAALLHLSHFLYQKPHFQELKLARIEYHAINFYLFSLTKVTEPDPLPWFDKWTAGKLFSFNWAILCMMLVFFYTSNLRAHLVTIEYEESPDTLDHIIKRGSVPYMYGTPRNSKRYLEVMNRTHTQLYKIVLQKEKMNGDMDLAKHNGLPKYVTDNVMDKGDFVMVEDHMIPYFDQIYPRFRRESIFMTKEYVEN